MKMDMEWDAADGVFIITVIAFLIIATVALTTAVNVNQHDKRIKALESTITNAPTR